MNIFKLGAGQKALGYILIPLAALLLGFILTAVAATFGSEVMYRAGLDRFVSFFPLMTARVPGGTAELNTFWIFISNMFFLTCVLVFKKFGKVNRDWFSLAVLAILFAAGSYWAAYIDLTSSWFTFGGL